MTALKEIFSLVGQDGIWRLCQLGDCADIIGFHMGRDILNEEAVQELILQCLQTSHDEGRNGTDRFLAGLLRQFRQDASDRIFSILMDQLVKNGLDQNTRLRLALAAPFERQTWNQLQKWDEDLERVYWEIVSPDWRRFDSQDLNYIIGKLIDAHRPRAAFFTMHLKPDFVETTYLIRILNELAINASEQTKYQPPSGHDIERALESLNERDDIDRMELVKLEYLYVEALTPNSKYAFPNLSREISSSPLLFMQLLAICFRRDDNGTDPEDWALPTDQEGSKNIASRAYCV